MINIQNGRQYNKKKDRKKPIKQSASPKSILSGSKRKFIDIKDNKMHNSKNRKSMMNHTSLLQMPLPTFPKLQMNHTQPMTLPLIPPIGLLNTNTHPLINSFFPLSTIKSLENEPDLKRQRQNNHHALSLPLCNNNNNNNNNNRDQKRFISNIQGMIIFDVQNFLLLRFMIFSADFIKGQIYTFYTLLTNIYTSFAHFFFILLLLL